jgi:molybdate transport system ATP-binding protein
MTGMDILSVRAEATLGRFNLDAAFDCPAAGVIALFGPSGSGKTSLVEMLAGLSRPRHGRISVGDAVLFDSAQGIDLPPERRGLGYVFQDARLFPHLSVRRNLGYGMGRLPKTQRAAAFDRVVGLLGIEGVLDRLPHRLSGGEKQRVAIGRALLAAPRLLLMDEPLSSLDQARKDEILPFIARLRAELSLPIVYVTHSMEEILRLADWLAVMERGRVVACGAVEDVVSDPDLPQLVARRDAGTLLPAKVAGIDKTFGLMELRFAAGRLLVPGTDLPIGEPVRVRIRARDIMLSLGRPEGLSALNQFPAVVAELPPPSGPQVDVVLALDGAEPPVMLRARVTAKSVEALGLRPGLPVHAVIKAVALDRGSIADRGLI